MIESHPPTPKVGKMDLFVIFPPQWSPFQPFLSTPSLKAYLEERNFRVWQEDWNMGFYEYFISEQRVQDAMGRLERYTLRLPLGDEFYRAKCLQAIDVLEHHREYRLNAAQLKSRKILEDIPRFKQCVNAFNDLLFAFSTAEPVIEMSAASFTHHGVLDSFDTLGTFVEDPISNPFLDYFTAKMRGISHAPRYFGISIIGSEQVVPGLTLCRVIKSFFPQVPIIIGGSVFSRVIEKDTSANDQLFGRYFDYICRYEGEKPMAAFLDLDDPSSSTVPNIAFMRDGNIQINELCEPSSMEDLPTPSFDGMALEDYYAPEPVLPLLATRGCYWGKCAFCYHGMVYQDRYRMRIPERIVRDVTSLNERYGARHFSFNDEAIPPKLFRHLPDVMPPGKYYFTGLYKFERFFTPEDYKRMYDIGFRSFYIGLETASERVQKHMLKNNLNSTMRNNLRWAHDAGIWNHTFNFFGFPTETEEEATQTINFLLDNANMIHSEGTSTFAFEHNAPVFNAPERFGIKQFVEKRTSILELYYDYEVESGLDALGAEQMLQRFTELKRQRGVFQDEGWIPREYLLLLLSYYDRDELRKKTATIAHQEEEDLTSFHVGDALTTFQINGAGVARHFILNRKRHLVCETNEDALTVVRSVAPDMRISDLVTAYPELVAIA